MNTAIANHKQKTDGFSPELIDGYNNWHTKLARIFYLLTKVGATTTHQVQIL